jgi:uncharacterized protein
MEQLGALQTICRYPVKSMAGEEIEEAFIGYSGMMGDRVYAFVRADGPKGFPWHTGREQEDLLLFRPRFRRTEAVTLPIDVEARSSHEACCNRHFNSARRTVLRASHPARHHQVLPGICRRAPRLPPLLSLVVVSHVLGCLKR